MQRKPLISGLIAALSLIVAALYMPGHASALDLKGYGLGPMGMGHHGLLSGALSSGSRTLQTGNTSQSADGKGLVVRFEGAALYKNSIVDNPAGLLFGAEVGYLGNGLEITSSNELLAPMAIVAHLWLGFPVHAFGIGDSSGGFRLFVEPGVGVDFVHIYAYIKAKAAFAIPGGLFDGELSWQWTPMEMSSTWGTTGRGQNMAQARLTVFVPGELKAHVFVDLTQSNMERYGKNTTLKDAGAKAYGNVDPLEPLERTPFLRIWRLGVGKTF